MTALIRAEIRKLATTRTFPALAIGAFALIVGGVTANAATATFAGVSPARASLTLAGLAQTFALLAGALAVTGEYRHKTITTMVLISPRRTPALAAKLITQAGAGLAFGILATSAATAIAVPVLAARHLASGVDAVQLAGVIVGAGLATALFAAIGVGVGAVIRNQVGAVVTVLALLYVAEPLLGFIPGIGTAVQQYGLGGLASGAAGTTGYPATTHLLGQAPAAAVVAGYAAVAVVAGAALLRRRDIAA